MRKVKTKVNANCGDMSPRGGVGTTRHFPFTKPVLSAGLLLVDSSL
jgi:hypothetical protein